MKTCSIYRGYRFPPDIIAHAVWLYHWFALSLRDVENLLAERGIEVSYETIRQWSRPSGHSSLGVYAQRFLSVFSQCHNLFRLGRHLLSAAYYRLLRARSFGTWATVTCA